MKVNRIGLGMSVGLVLLLISSGSISAAPTRKIGHAVAKYKTRRLRLPVSRWDRGRRAFHGAERHSLGKRISVEQRGRWLVKRIETDSAVKEDSFVRTVRTLHLRANGSKKSDKQETVKSDPFRPRWRSNEARYLVSNKRLGPTYDHKQGKTALRVWWPDARRVEVELIDAKRRIRMRPDHSGVWQADLGRPGKLFGKRYRFLVDGKAVPDPYGHSQDGDHGPSRFVDLRFNWTDKNFRPPKRTEDWVIAEVHVGDETSDPHAPVPKELRGTYRGMAHPKVVAYYKKLGVNAIELLPLQQSVEGKHWGYMTSGFFAPADRFASRPENAPRDLQKMVDAYHRAGIAVVMDVVYNHTANDLAQFSLFEGKYYYRHNEKGDWANASGCGNEFATENPMVRKLVLDSKRFWMEQYHIDGLRDDLAVIIDPHTMRKGRRLKLKRSTQSKRRFFSAEPWAWERDRMRWKAGDLDHPSERPISSWDGAYREGTKAFVKGQGRLSDIKTLIAGNVLPYGEVRTPQQMMKYLESHDELTIADTVTDPARARLALGLLSVTQGPIMLGHAQEIMRSKNGVSNLYDDPITGRKPWRQVKSAAGVLDFASAMIALRKETPYFRYGRALTERELRWVDPQEGKRDTWLGFSIKAPAEVAAPKNQGAWPEVMVFANAEEHGSATFRLPRGRWKVVSDGQRVDAKRGVSPPATATYLVPPKSFVLLSKL